MSFISNASALNILVLLSFFCGSSCENSNTKLGYLQRNITVRCVDPPETEICPIQGKVLSISGRETPLIQQSLHVAKIYLDLLPNDVNSSCRENVREYVCSQHILICDEKNGTASNNVERSRRSCVDAKSICPVAVQRIGILHCSDIHRQETPFQRCVRLPDTFCPKRDYKVLESQAKLYITIVKHIQNIIDTTKPYLSSVCHQRFVNLLCYIYGGPVCSDDGNQLVHVVSQQQCRHAIQQCMPKNIPANIDINVDAICDILPNAETATRVPLPTGVDVDAIIGKGNGNGLQPAFYFLIFNVLHIGFITMRI